MGNIVSLGKGYANAQHLLAEMQERAADMEWAMVIFQPKTENMVIEGSNDMKLSDIAFAAMNLNRVFDHLMDC